MLGRIAGLVLVGSLLVAGPVGAQSAGSSLTAPATKAATAAPATSRPWVMGAGAVAGYFLMMNPFGAALMGAAMGGMIAVAVYDSYNPEGATGH